MNLPQSIIKNFRAQLREQQEQERQAELRRKGQAREQRDYIDNLERGQVVRYSQLVYAGTNTPANVQRLYFVARVSDDSVLLSDKKADAMRGYGYLYAVNGILIPKGA